MAFLSRLKRNLSSIPGWGGGTLQDQIDQNPAMLRTPPAPIGERDTPPVQGTPEWEAAMRRAQPVRASEIPQPADTMADPAASRQRAVSFDPATGKPNEDYYRNHNDLSGLYNAEQGWNPRGAKRGFKNSLKSAAMMAAEAVRNNPEHPVEAAIAGAGVGAIGGTAAPNFKNRLTRQWKLNQVSGELGNQLELKKQQAQIAALNQRPQVQQDAQQEREINNALTQYNRLEHYDPDDPADIGIKQYFESRGLKLPKRDKYHRPIVSWANGQMVITDSGGTRKEQIEGEPVIDTGRVPNEQGLTPNQAAIQGSQTANRNAANTRAANVQAGADRRAGMRGGNAATPKPNAATTRRAALLIGQINRAISAIGEADARLTKNPGDKEAARQRESAKQAGAGWAAELNSLGAGYEAGMGEKDYPYFKQITSAPAPSGAVNTDLVDPKIKQYADRYFGGSYEKALKAIAAQRKGQ